MKTAAGFATTAGACALVSMTVVAPASAEPTTTTSQPSLRSREATLPADAPLDAWFALRWGNDRADDEPEAGSPDAPTQAPPAVSHGSAPTLVRSEARR